MIVIVIAMAGAIVNQGHLKIASLAPESIPAHSGYFGVFILRISAVALSPTYNPKNPSSARVSKIALSS